MTKSNMMAFLWNIRWLNESEPKLENDESYLVHQLNLSRLQPGRDGTKHFPYDTFESSEDERKKLLNEMDFFFGDANERQLWERKH